MQKRFELLRREALHDLDGVSTLDEFESLKNAYFGRKNGTFSVLMREMSGLPVDKRPVIGALANTIKTELEEAFAKKEQSFDRGAVGSAIDVTMSKRTRPIGHINPLTQVEFELEDIFSSMGFMVVDGPELESDYYNFEGLNIPSWHPARDAQDTFFVESAEKLVLRTQTSSVQVRAMQKYGAPLRLVVPGRVFRNEDLDASHEHTFDQFEGLLVDKNISITDLIAVMREMLSGIFKKEVEVRLRPGYFPFVEPGFELDFACLICEGKGCPVCKHEGWVEFMGSGLVHPAVLRHGGIDPEEYSGFAFGGGVDRLVMMKYAIDDIRLFRSGDLRFINQF